MKMSRLFVAGAVVALLTVRAPILAAEPESSSENAIRLAGEEGQTLFLVFYRSGDAATKTAVGTVQTHVEKNPGTTWAKVSVADPAQGAVVERFGVSRAPMPMVIALHPNGAITGAFPGKVTAEGLAQCAVSPKKAECMKTLQQSQMALVFVQTKPGQALPRAAQDWMADPHFGPRTKVVTVALQDPGEAKLVSEMQVAPQQLSPLTVLLAPPGVLVGKFTTTATKDQMAGKLAEAGKCCDDANCKHNQRAPSAAKPGQVNR